MPVVELSTIATEPVSVEEVKTHLRIDGNAEDSYLRDFLIPTARRQCEAFSRKVFVKRSFRQDFEGCQWMGMVGRFGLGPIPLDRAPLDSITSISYYATGSTAATTWSSTNYLADTTSIPGAFYLDKCSSWPALDSTRFNAFQVTYVAGCSSTAEGVPADYRHACLLWCAHLYEHRGDENKEPPQAIKDLLRPTRNYRFK